MHTPNRQCISCRKKGEKVQFLRIVNHARGGIVLDADHKLQGRGAYLCRDSGCIEKARVKGILRQALRAEIPNSIFARLADTISNRKDSLETLLGFAARAGKLVLGTTAVENAARKKNIHVLILDGGARSTTRKRIEGIRDSCNIPLIMKSTGRSIEDIVGRSNCRCVGVQDASFARSILEETDSSFQ